MRTRCGLLLVLAACATGAPSALWAQSVPVSAELGGRPGTLVQQARLVVQEQTQAGAPATRAEATKHDSIWNGVLEGAATGALAGGVIILLAENDSLWLDAKGKALVLLVGTAAGAAVGGLVDSMRQDSQPVASTPQARGHLRTSARAPGWRAAVNIPVRF